MEKRTRKIRVINTIVLCFVIICSVLSTSYFFENRESRKRYASFLEGDTGYDVFLLGSSHVRYGFYPMELWNDYGITSYNIAADGSTIPVTYWTLVNALDYHTPKLVIIDIFDIWPGKIVSPSWGQLKAAVDFFPLSVNKFHMVMDLISDPNLAEENDNTGTNIYNRRWELLFPLAGYHSRWNDITAENFNLPNYYTEVSSIWKGAEPLTDIVERHEAKYDEDWEKYKYDELAAEYLEKTIELCRSKGIDVLLIDTGYDAEPESKLFAMSIEDIAKQYSVNFVDLTKMDIINFEIDLDSTDDNTHVNHSGAEKLSSYLGAYISSNYGLTDHRNESAYINWWKDYNRFTDSKMERLKEQANLPQYMMFLLDDIYSIEIEIMDISVLENTFFKEQLKDMGVDLRMLEDCNLIYIDRDAEEIRYVRNNNIQNEDESKVRITVYSVDYTKKIDERKL